MALPVMGKIIEAILRTRIRKKTDDLQSPLQRGFTVNSSPMNAALVDEETRRNYKYEKTPLVPVALDAKSTFDVVVHKTLMRRLYLCGVDDKHWSLVNSLHTGATSAVKWAECASDFFPSGTRGTPRWHT